MAVAEIRARKQLSHLHDTNGQDDTSLSVRLRLGKALSQRVTKKQMGVGAGIIAALLGYSQKDHVMPAYVSQAWMQAVDGHIAKAADGYRQLGDHDKAIASMQGEVRLNREETIANRAAIQELTRSVDRLSDRLDKIYPLLTERRAR